jgi:hypothetical protein
MYLANRLNGECPVVCAFLSSRVQSPTKENLFKLKCLLQYLNLNPDLRLAIEIGTKLGVVQHTDASYGVHADGITTLDLQLLLVVLFMAGLLGLEAELLGLSDEASRRLWCSYF